MDSDWIIPLIIFSIPIVAISGGIISGIVRSAGQQRLLELAQRERIAAIERGLDPAKLPPLPQMALDVGSLGYTPAESAKRRAQSLTIGGLVTMFSGIGLLIFLLMIEPEKALWSVGLIPIFAGVALLISAFILWPRNGHDRPRAPLS